MWSPPRIYEEDDARDVLPAAESLFEFVRNEIVPGSEVGLIHGRMKNGEQQDVLDAFRLGRVRVLVSTTVIEVGVDVPGAGLILIDGAECFGLSQLHQLRGRVGRSEQAAVCLAVAGQTDEEGRRRLEIFSETDDGFVLAEEDLKMRGPGDPVGLRQSGFPKLIWARLPLDLPLLFQARDLTVELLRDDPELNRPEFKLVREVLDQVDRSIQSELTESG